MRNMDAVALIERRVATISHRYPAFPREVGMVTRLIRRLNMLIDRDAVAVLRPLGIEHADYLILITLYGCDEGTMSRPGLVRATHRKPAELGRRLVALGEKGLITRVANAASRAKAAFMITDAGEELLEYILSNMAAMMSYERRGISDSEMDGIQALLQKMIRRLESG